MKTLQIWYHTLNKKSTGKLKNTGKVRDICQSEKVGTMMCISVTFQAETQHLEMQRLMRQSHSGGFTRQGIEELQKISHMHLLLGNMHRYCEILIEMGEVRHAQL